MRYIRPGYYDNFQCAADKCPDTCCAGWQIVIDEESLKKYADKKGPVGRRLAESIDWQEECFFQNQGRCAFLNERNLCDLVTEEGEQMLCKTCASYPRHVEEYDGLRELSLSLSCPVAAEMILTEQEPFFFLTEENEESDPLEDEFEDFDFLMFTALEDARGVLFELLQKRNLSLQERMKMILELAARMQDCVDEDRVFELEDVIFDFADDVRHREDAGGGGVVRNPSMETAQADADNGRRDSARQDSGRLRFERLRENFCVFYQMEQLREEWSGILDGVQNTLYGKDYEAYAKLRSEFLRQFGEEDETSLWWQRFLENLLVFFLYTYFCGAVYDDWIYSKAAMGVFSVCYLEELVMGSWAIAGRKISREKCIELAWRYARELEHSDENLNLLEEWLQERR